MGADVSVINEKTLASSSKELNESSDSLAGMLKDAIEVKLEKTQKQKIANQLTMVSLDNLLDLEECDDLEVFLQDKENEIENISISKTLIAKFWRPKCHQKDILVIYKGSLPQEVVPFCRQLNSSLLTWSSTSIKEEFLVHEVVGKIFDMYNKEFQQIIIWARELDCGSIIETLAMSPKHAWVENVKAVVLDTPYYSCKRLATDYIEKGCREITCNPILSTFLLSVGKSLGKWKNDFTKTCQDLGIVVKPAKLAPKLKFPVTIITCSGSYPITEDHSRDLAKVWGGEKAIVQAAATVTRPDVDNKWKRKVASSKQIALRERSLMVDIAHRVAKYLTFDEIIAEANNCHMNDACGVIDDIPVVRGVLSVI